MTNKHTNLEDQLNDMSLKLVMIDSDDLTSLGEILTKTEEIGELFKDNGVVEVDLIFTGLKNILEGVILDNITEKTVAMEIVGEGVNLLQEAQQELARGGEFKGDMDGFRSRLSERLRIEIGSSEPVPDQTPSSQEDSEGSSQTAGENIPAAEMNLDEELCMSFISESREHIETSEVSLISLEQDPEDSEIINTIFRCFHSIKGVAGFLNLHSIQSLTHEIENLLNDTRNGVISVTSSVIDLLLDAVDFLKEMIDDLELSLENDQPVKEEYPVSQFIDRIKAIQHGFLSPESEPDYGNRNMMLGEILVVQGLITEVELSEAIENQEHGKLVKLGEILVEKGILDTAALEEALAIQVEKEGQRLGEILIESGQVSPIEISKALDEQSKLRERKLGEVLVTQGGAKARDVAVALRDQKKTAKTERTVKVDTSKLDLLVDMVGELVIAQSQVTENKTVLNLKDQKLIRDLSQMTRITSELQNTSMALRMVPIRQTFQRMIRLVRDVSRKSGKEVELILNGEDTEIDRNMVEALYDPLVHLMRNAVDHGIESPDERTKKGKPSQGQLQLSAYHQGGGIVIEITDDGQGLNRDKILTKAKSLNLIENEENASDTAVFNLILLPGFSTADRVTDVSGRGVGMDVVKKTMDKLRGRIDITSQPGEGSTFCLRLPLTLAIIDGMLIRIGDRRYIIPTLTIRETFRPEKGSYYTVQGRGEMLKIRDELLPLIRLYKLLEVPVSTTDPTEALVVVVENEGEQRCLLVDEALGKQEVVIKSLGDALKNVPGVAGGTILGDGNVGLILDIGGLFEANDNLESDEKPELDAAANLPEDGLTSAEAI